MLVNARVNIGSQRSKLLINISAQLVDVSNGLDLAVLFDIVCQLLIRSQGSVSLSQSIRLHTVSGGDQAVHPGTDVADLRLQSLSVVALVNNNSALLKTGGQLVVSVLHGTVDIAQSLGELSLLVCQLSFHPVAERSKLISTVDGLVSLGQSHGIGQVSQIGAQQSVHFIQAAIVSCQSVLNLLIQGAVCSHNGINVSRRIDSHILQTIRLGQSLGSSLSSIQRLVCSVQLVTALQTVQVGNCISNIFDLVHSGSIGIILQQISHNILSSIDLSQLSLGIVLHLNDSILCLSHSPDFCAGIASFSQSAVPTAIDGINSCGQSALSALQVGDEIDQILLALNSILLEGLHAVFTVLRNLIIQICQLTVDTFGLSILLQQTVKTISQQSIQILFGLNGHTVLSSSLGDQIPGCFLNDIQVILEVLQLSTDLYQRITTGHCQNIVIVTVILITDQCGNQLSTNSRIDQPFQIALGGVCSEEVLQQQTGGFVFIVTNALLQKTLNRLLECSTLSKAELCDPAAVLIIALKSQREQIVLVNIQTIGQFNVHAIFQRITNAIIQFAQQAHQGHTLAEELADRHALTVGQFHGHEGQNHHRIQFQSSTTQDGRSSTLNKAHQSLMLLDLIDHFLAKAINAFLLGLAIFPALGLFRNNVGLQADQLFDISGQQCTCAQHLCLIILSQVHIHVVSHFNRKSVTSIKCVICYAIVHGQIFEVFDRLAIHQNGIAHRIPFIVSAGSNLALHFVANDFIEFVSLFNLNERTTISGDNIRIHIICIQLSRLDNEFLIVG